MQHKQVFPTEIKDVPTAIETILVFYTFLFIYVSKAQIYYSALKFFF